MEINSLLIKCNYEDGLKSNEPDIEILLGSSNGYDFFEVSCFGWLTVKFQTNTFGSSFVIVGK